MCVKCCESFFRGICACACVSPCACSLHEIPVRVLFFIEHGLLRAICASMCLHVFVLLASLLVLGWCTLVYLLCTRRLPPLSRPRTSGPEIPRLPLVCVCARARARLLPLFVYSTHSLSLSLYSTCQTGSEGSRSQATQAQNVSVLRRTDCLAVVCVGCVWLLMVVALRCLLLQG